jgi:O-antigen ligase
VLKQPPHNTIVQSIVEMGVVGLLAYLAFITLLARDLARSIRRSRGRPGADVAVLVALICVGYFMIGQFENLITQVVTSAPLALLTGAVLGSAHVEPAPAAANE